MHTLAVVAVLFCAGAIVTIVGAWLIERMHPPRGRFVEIDGYRQHVFELGAAGHVPAAAPVVLLHGAACNLEDMYLALGERLAGSHRVVLTDRPGLGWSTRKAGQGSSPADQARVLTAVLDRLGIERAILIGHSWGGALALAFALDHPRRTAGLVLVAPPLYARLPLAHLVYRVLAACGIGPLLAHTLALPFGAMVIGLGFRGAFLPQAPPPRYLRRSAALLLLRPRTFLANAADVGNLKRFLLRQTARYATLSVPSIIVTGDRDKLLASRRHAEKLAAAVPHAKLIVLPGFGHMLHHAAADRIIAAVRELASRELAGDLVEAPAS